MNDEKKLDAVKEIIKIALLGFKIQDENLVDEMSEHLNNLLDDIMEGEYYE